MLTLRGADVSLGDIEGWQKVEEGVREVSDNFKVDFAPVASEFRVFLDERALSRKVAISGDNWWHGFQHGMGILGHAAPVVWALGKRTVYIASSFTALDRGKVTCASDPTIDNKIRFCGARAVHDGYDLSRQEKVANIVRFSRETETPVSLHVCWESEGGSNCCRCEKCLRTILAIYAEGADPRNFGFTYEDIDVPGKWFEKAFSTSGSDSRLLQRYIPIQETMRRNLKRDEVAYGLLWFYDGDLTKLVHASIPKCILRKVARKVHAMFS